MLSQSSSCFSLLFLLTLLFKLPHSASLKDVPFLASALNHRVATRRLAFFSDSDLFRRCDERRRIDPHLHGPPFEGPLFSLLRTHFAPTCRGFPFLSRHDHQAAFLGRFLIFHQYRARSLLGYVRPTSPSSLDVLRSPRRSLLIVWL